MDVIQKIFLINLQKCLNKDEVEMLKQSTCNTLDKNLDQ